MKELSLKEELHLFETSLKKVFDLENQRYADGGTNLVYRNQPKKRKDQDWFIKKSNSGSLAAISEYLVYRLYKLFGIRVPSGVFLAIHEGEALLVTKSSKGKQIRNISELVKTDFRKGFFIDAFLANWDVVGMRPYNLFVDEEEAIRIDPGGALAYRAQGELKGGLFNDQVNELETFLGKTNLWSDGIKVFSGITEKELEDSAEIFLSVSPEDVIKTIDLVEKYVISLSKYGLPESVIQETKKYFLNLKTILPKRFKKIENYIINQEENYD